MRGLVSHCDANGVGVLRLIGSSEIRPIKHGGGVQRDRPVDDLGRGLDAPLIFQCRRITKEAKHTKIGRELDDPVISSINFRVVRIFRGSS